MKKRSPMKKFQKYLKLLENILVHTLILNLYYINLQKYILKKKDLELII